MVKILIDLSDEEDKIVEVYKLVNTLKTKQDSIKEMIKYFHNVHGAVKVIFANQMYDLCRALNINYDIVKECAAASKHIMTDMYLNVWHGKYRGYGGSCFPKDIRALTQFGDKNGVDLALLKTAEKINNQLMKAQKIKYPEKLGKDRKALNNNGKKK